MDIFIVSVLLVLILILGFLIRVPYFNFPMDEDFGFYTYIPYFYNRGLRFIKDFWGGPPSNLLFVIQWLYKTFKKDVSTIRMFATIFHLITIFSVFEFTRRFFGDEAALIASLFYAVYPSVPFLTWFSIHNENYYLFPVTWALYFYLLGVESNELLFYSLSGVFFAAGFLIKIVVAAYIVLFSGYLLAGEEYQFLLYFLSGCVIPVFLYFAVITHIYRGRNQLVWLHFLLRLKGFSNISWLEYREGLLFRNFVNLFHQTTPVWIGIALYFVIPANNVLYCYGAATLLIFLAQKGFSLYHYLPIIHILSIQAGVVLAALLSKEKTLFIGILLTGLVIFIIFHLLKTIWQYFASSKNYSSFNKSDQYYYLPFIADDLKKRIPQEGRFYIWGSYTQLYQMCNRPASDQFLFFFMGPFQSKVFSHFYDTIVGGIIQHKPAYILQTHHTLNMQALSEATALHYVVEKVYFNKFRLWRFEDSSISNLHLESLSWEEKNHRLEKISSGHVICGLDTYYFEEGMFGEGEKECQAALKINPDDFDNLIYLGVILREEGKYEEAFKIFDDLLKQKLEKRIVYNVYLNMGITHHRMRNYQTALNDYRKALKIKKRFPDLFLNRGVTLREMGDIDASLKNLNHAEKIILKSKNFEAILPDTLTQLGITWRKKNNYKKALNYFKKALALTPNENLHAYIFYQCGSALEYLKRWPEAIKSFEMLLKTKDVPKELKYGVYYHLGNIYKKKYENEKAAKYFKKCLRTFPDHKNAKKELEELSVC